MQGLCGTWQLAYRDEVALAWLHRCGWTGPRSPATRQQSALNVRGLPASLEAPAPGPEGTRARGASGCFVGSAGPMEAGRGENVARRKA